MLGKDGIHMGILQNPFRDHFFAPLSVAFSSEG